MAGLKNKKCGKLATIRAISKTGTGNHPLFIYESYWPQN